LASEDRLLIDWDALLFIEALPRQQGRLLRQRLLEICEYPNRFGDFEEPDLKRRPLSVHIYREFAIWFWHDFNDRHVKVLRIGWADRA
jgi:hypothetical protein